MKAARSGKANCVEALLEWGADKDAADSDGDTAMHEAAREGHLECARLLVEARADRAKNNNKGQTALELARQEGSFDSEEQKQGKAEIVALLEQADRGEAGTAAQEGVPPAAP